LHALYWPACQKDEPENLLIKIVMMLVPFLVSLHFSTVLGIDFGSENIKVGMVVPDKSVHVSFIFSYKRRISLKRTM